MRSMLDGHLFTRIFLLRMNTPPRLSLLSRKVSTLIDFDPLLGAPWKVDLHYGQFLHAFIVH